MCVKLVFLGSLREGEVTKDLPTQPKRLRFCAEFPYGPTWFRSYRQCMAMFQSLQWMSPDSWDKAVVQPITKENDETRSR